MSYSKYFYLTEKKGNNAFAWEERGKAPRLYVPSVINGNVDDVKVGRKVLARHVLRKFLLQC